MSLIDELRSLSPVLSPSVRASGAEVADLLSALVAYTEHGDKLIAAAHEGPQAVADFYHDHAVDQAAEAGHPEPEKGAPVGSGPISTAATAGPGGGVSQGQFNELSSKFDQLLAAITGKTSASPPAADSAPVGDAGGHAATPDAPAGVPDQTGAGA